MNKENNILSVNVSDSVIVDSKMTFDSEQIGNIKITYWMEDNVKEKIDEAFDILFNEMILIETKIEN